LVSLLAVARSNSERIVNRFSAAASEPEPNSEYSLLRYGPMTGPDATIAHVSRSYR
jgi:hypothetical protein